MLMNTVQPWVVVVTRPLNGWNPAEDRSYCGDPRDIILQGFHWDSHRGVHDSATGLRKSWYRVVEENAPHIRNAGFSWIWLPPCSDSLAPQGYIPRRWNVFDSAYGSEGELRSAIKSLGPVNAMADLVLNHRVGVATSGADFQDPEFPDNRAAIVCNDESGVGTGHPDTGETHPCGRDLDHQNPGVRATIKAYLDKLKSLGFKGWRYDLVKGYAGKFIREYNESSCPALSVGECFERNRQVVTDWIDSTGGKSTAFDFPTRYLLYEALRDDDYRSFRSTNGGRTVPGGLIGFWPGRAVTFVDNHDTEYRRDRDHHSNYDATRHIPGHQVDMAYAYILTHPGIPCVFWSHLFDWGEATRRRITRLMFLRRATNLHAGSEVDIREARKGLYAAVIDGRVAMKLGPAEWHPGGNWHLAVEGKHFTVWHQA